MKSTTPSLQVAVKLSAEQLCLCVLSAIAEVGGVPFEILEPVLERCTPEQLYRIEQSNQVPELEL